ncbi:MAG: hypothetical protein HZC28_09450 [Spirochaetes bacterium]|nr:hypothetical protein [Spirochaetota bacterium]
MKNFSCRKPLLIAAAGIIIGAVMLFSQNDITATDIPGTRSSVFELRVNGIPVPVISFKDIHYAQFTMSKQATVAVTLKNGTPSNAAVQPTPFGISTDIKDNTVRFTIPKPMQTVVQVDTLEKLFLFAEPIAETPANDAVNAVSAGAVGDGITDNTAALQKAIDVLPKGGTLLIPAGHFRSGSLLLRSDMTLFLAPGALLQAVDDHTKITPSPGGKNQIVFITAAGATNLTIAGYGIIDANGYVVRKAYEKSEGVKKKAGRALVIKNATNVTVRGITVRDSYSWNIDAMFVDNLTFSGVKILSDVRISNHDGFDIESCFNVLVENCFVFSEDDALTPKARVGRDIVANYTFRNCVLWAHKANAIRIGSESACISMKHFLFENIYILNGADGIRLDTTEGAVYEDMTFRNIWIENLLQFYDDAYERNRERKPIDPSRALYFWVSRTKDAKSNYSPLGSIRNIHFENVHIADERIPSRIDIGDAVSRYALENGTTPLISGVSFTGCTRGGKPVEEIAGIGFTAPLEKYGKLVSNFTAAVK